MISLAFDANQYIAEYKKNRYSQINLRIPKGSDVILKELAQKMGKSVNQIIVDALEYHYGIDLHQPTQE